MVRNTFSLDLRLKQTPAQIKVETDRRRVNNRVNVPFTPCPAKHKGIPEKRKNILKQIGVADSLAPVLVACGGTRHARDWLWVVAYMVYASTLDTVGSIMLTSPVGSKQ